MEEPEVPAVAVFTVLMLDCTVQKSSSVSSDFLPKLVLTLARNVRWRSGTRPSFSMAVETFPKAKREGNGRDGKTFISTSGRSAHVIYKQY